jgi:hypothetical protein
MVFSVLSQPVVQLRLRLVNKIRALNKNFTPAHFDVLFRLTLLGTPFRILTGRITWCSFAHHAKFSFLLHISDFLAGRNRPVRRLT